MRVYTVLPQDNLSHAATAAAKAEADGYDGLASMENQHAPFLPHAAAITTTSGATANLEGDSDTTDVTITKISRTEYLNLSRKQEDGTNGDARPTQFCLINGQVTVNGGSNTGRPEHNMTLFVYPSPDKAYILKYFFINRIMDAGAYTNEADVPFYFLPCLVSGLAYYVSLKRAPMLTSGLKAVYDEEFERTADANRERVSFRVKPAQAYIP